MINEYTSSLVNREKPCNMIAKEYGFVQGVEKA